MKASQWLANCAKKKAPEDELATVEKQEVSEWEGENDTAIVDWMTSDGKCFM